jgi:hypothetical protein
MRATLVMVHMEGPVPVALVLLNCAFHQEEDAWLAECLDLGTATEAPTLEEATQQLVSLVNLHLNEVERLGISQQFLREHLVRSIQLPPQSGNKSLESSWVTPEHSLA